jgi:hypothetical protein
MRCSPLLSFCSRLSVLLISVFVISLPAQMNFAAPARYSPGGNGPNVVAMADLNGDGKLDIVVGNWCMNNTVPCPGSSVGVLLGNGDGTFKPGVAYASGGVYLPFVAIADLNGDGKLDIVAANCGNALNNHCIGAGGNMGVLLGHGDGTFQPATTIPLGGGGYGAIAVSIADVNGDGKPDLIAAGDCASGGCGGVLLGNGDGTFQAEIPFTTGGLIAFAMVVGDVNGDGKPDVVVGHQCATQNCHTSSIAVLLGNGDGTFQVATTYDAGGIYPDSIVLADLNADGKPDIVVANSSTSISINQGDVGILIGNGDGTFQTAVAYPASEFGAATVDVADVNGDGKPDVVVVNCSAVSGNCNGGGGNVGVLVGNGDGTLQPVVTFPPGGNTPFGMALGDVNGDGKPDIVVGNCSSNVCGQMSGNVAVLLNTSLAATATALTSSSSTSSFGQAVTFTATVTSQGFNRTPTGTVNFIDGTTTLGSSSVSGGVATLTTSTLTVGTHSITATYNGDANFALSTSPVVNQIVQGAQVQLSSTSLSFGNQTVGILSASQSVTLTNTGNLALTLAIAVTGTNSGDFLQSNTCGISVAAGGSCSITVAFKPLAAGARTAAVTITDNAANSPQSVSLAGTGVQAAVTFSPASLTFAPQTVNTTSTPQVVTLTNTGLGVLKITKAAITGPFTFSSTCSATVNPGGSCTLTVAFKPTTAGALTGSIAITDNAPLSPQTLALNGTGTSVKLAPASLNFGNQTVGTTSARKIITLTNLGSVALNISGIATTGTNFGDFAQVNNCGASVAAGASCSIAVTFTPSATGARSAMVSVTDDGGGGSQQVQLTGTGT